MGTLVSGSQINRRWALASGLGLIITGSAAIAVFVAQNTAGIATHKIHSDGSVTQSGSMLAKSGSTTAFYFSTLTSKVGIRTQSPKTELDVVGTMSGNALYVTRAMSGAGLADCDTGATSKLLWDASTGRFSCGTDQNSATAYTAGQGLSLNSNRFSLNTTITGSLVSFQTVSGSTVFAKTTLASSGSLKVLGNMSGASLNVNNLKSCTNIQSNSAGALSCNSTSYQSTTLAEDNVWVGNGTAQAAALPSCSAAGDTLNYNTSTNAFACGSDADTTYTAGQGLTLTATKFRTNDTLTGSMVRAMATLASSGTLAVENNASIQGVLTLTTALAHTSGGTGLSAYPTRTIILTAGGGLPSPLTGSGASGPERYTGSTNDTSMYVLEYGNFSKARYAMWTATMPDNYDGGTMTFVFNWKTAATSGDVKWYIQCRSLGDNEAIDQSWGTAAGVADTAATANSVRISSATAAVTCAGTPAGGELVQFRVYRDAADAADTLANTGALISVKGEYLTNSYTD